MKAGRVEEREGMRRCGCELVVGVMDYGGVVVGAMDYEGRRSRREAAAVSWWSELWIIEGWWSEQEE